jgi:aspartyl-tRNA(Asn)/glutamyl-tRNA(Gln) amidotransferase subunit B
MQEGSFRCDANVSVRKPGGPLGTRREIKNLNSFKFMQQAIDFEVRWQIEQIEDGHAIQQATVLFNPDTGETRAMRTKEDAADYRYFPDPDLPPLVVSRAWVEEVKVGMPELPRVMAQRFVAQYGLPEYDVGQLTRTLATASYFEEACQFRTGTTTPKHIANWMMGDVARRLNASEVDFDRLRLHIQPVKFADVVNRVVSGEISNAGGKAVFDVWWPLNTVVQLSGVVARAELGQLSASSDIDAIIEAKGLKQVNDTGALEAIADQVIAANAKNVAEYQAGNAKALNALVGQIMKASGGKANPQQVNELLRQKLG